MTAENRRGGLTKAAITVGFFSAAGVLGGLLKVPSPVGSIALDSLPGYFAAAFFHPLIGAVVGAISHLGSAATAGFPLGGWLHINVSVHMFVWCALFGIIFRTKKTTTTLVLAALVAITLNGLGSPLLLVPVGLPVATAKAVAPFVLVAAALNVAIAAAAIVAVAKMDITDI